MNDSIPGRRPRSGFATIPPDVPAEIDPDSIPSLKQLYEDACRDHAGATAYSNMGRTLTLRGHRRASRRFGAWLQKVAGLAEAAIASRS